MKDILQHNENLLFIEQFQVFRARTNLVSFFRNLLLNLFGQVDSKLSVYIPDINDLLDKKSNRSVYKFADVQQSIVKILKRFSEKKRAVPFVIIVPGLLSEFKFEMSGDNLHFETPDGLTYGSASDTEVTFIVGSEDDGRRIQLSDILYSSFTQFFRKNYIYKSDHKETMYSLIVKNDSVKMSTEGEINVSDYEKIYTVGINVKMFLEWSYTVDKSLFLTNLYHSLGSQPPSDELEDQLDTAFQQTFGELDTQPSVSELIYEFIETNLDKLDWQESVLSKEVTEPPPTVTEGDRYLLFYEPVVSSPWEGNKNTIAVFRDGSWEFLTPDEGFTTRVEDEDDMKYLFLENNWLADEFNIVDGGSFV